MSLLERISGPGMSVNPSMEVSETYLNELKEGVNQIASPQIQELSKIPNTNQTGAASPWSVEAAAKKNKLDADRISGPSSPTIDSTTNPPENDLDRIKQLVDQVAPACIQNLSSLPNLNQTDAASPWSVQAAAKKSKINEDHTRHIITTVISATNYLTGQVATKQLETKQANTKIRNSIDVSASLPHLSASDKAVDISPELRQKFENFETNYGIRLIEPKETTLTERLITKIKDVLSNLNDATKTEINSLMMIDLQNIIQDIKTLLEQANSAARRNEESNRKISNNQRA